MGGKAIDTVHLHLRNPEPDLLQDVLWDLLWPLSILRIKRCLSSGDVRILWPNPGRTLEDLPEQVEDEENWNADIGSKEVCEVLVQGLGKEYMGGTYQ